MKRISSQREEEGRQQELTFSKLRQKDRGRLRDESTLSSDADAGSNVVSTDDSLGDTSSSKDGNGSRRRRLELVLKDDESKELKTRFGLLSAKVDGLESARARTQLEGTQMRTHRFIR